MNIKEFHALLEDRASHRKFLPDLIPEEDICTLIDNARLAPSGHNFQPWKFIAVTNKEVISRMADTVETNLQTLYTSLPGEMIARLEKYKFFIKHFQDAPLVIVVCAREYEYISSQIESEHHAGLPEAKLFNMTLLGVGAAINNLLLTAEVLGYGSCWMTEPVVYAQRDIEQILGIKEPYRFVSLIALGKPTRVRRGAEKKSVEELLTILD